MFFPPQQPRIITIIHLKKYFFLFLVIFRVGFVLSSLSHVHCHPNIIYHRQACRFSFYYCVVRAYHFFLIFYDLNKHQSLRVERLPEERYDDEWRARSNERLYSNKTTMSKINIPTIRFMMVGGLTTVLVFIICQSN